MSPTLAQTLRLSLRSWVSSDLVRVGPYWLQWVWTLLFCALLAVAFTVLGFLAFGPNRRGWGTLDGWLFWYGKNFVVCLTIGVIIHLLFEGLGRLVGGAATLRRLRPGQRSLFFAGVPILGLTLGWPLGIWLSGSAEAFAPFFANPRSLALSLLLSLGISLSLHFYFAARTRQIAAEARATEAQLRLLQAQIEPHFLFNTLANVQSLMDHDPPRAHQMLADFTDYLRSSLGTLRGQTSRVEQELALARSYLQLLQGRMEDRLRFHIDAEPATLQLPLPPLLLQPLVENAIVHGLEPSVDGGAVYVSARVRDARLVLEVRDTGLGLRAQGGSGARPGNGMALENIRQRLLTRWGNAAWLEIGPAEPDAVQPGTLARITLPPEGPAT